MIEWMAENPVLIAVLFWLTVAGIVSMCVKDRD